MTSIGIFQLMWAMELKRPEDFEWDLKQKITKIAKAGFSGLIFDLSYHSFDDIKRALSILKEHDLDLVSHAFVKDIKSDQLIVDFVNHLQLNTRLIGFIGQIETSGVKKVADTIEQWFETVKQADIATYVEAHRNCMTNDLQFTLDPMESIPQLSAIADRPYVLTNQEWYLPLHYTAKKHMSSLFKRTEAFQSRLANREQIQAPFNFDQHKPWYEFVQAWWHEGFSTWLKRHGIHSDDRTVFLNNLGPTICAITGHDGYGLNDR